MTAQIFFKILLLLGLTFANAESLDDQLRRFVQEGSEKLQSVNKEKPRCPYCELFDEEPLDDKKLTCVDKLSEKKSLQARLNGAYAFLESSKSDAESQKIGDEIAKVKRELASLRGVYSLEFDSGIKTVVREVSPQKPKYDPLPRRCLEAALRSRPLGTYYQCNHEGMKCHGTLSRPLIKNRRGKIIPSSNVICSNKEVPEEDGMKFYCPKGEEPLCNFNKFANSASCPTDDYLSDLNETYNKVFECLDIPPKEVWGMLSHESGLQLNVVNSIGASSFHQALPISITDVNDNIEDLIKPLNRPGCEKFKKFLPPESQAFARFSDRCAILGNPVRSLLYAGLFYLKNQKYVDGVFKKYKVLPQRMGLSDENYYRLRTYTIQLGNDTGGETAALLLVRYINVLNSKGIRLTDQNFDYYFNFNGSVRSGGKRFMDFVFSRYGNEAGNYLRKINASVQSYAANPNLGENVCMESSLYQRL